MSWKNFSLEQAGARFDASQDFTIGIEEEFQILDPETLELSNSFEELYREARPLLFGNVTGELIASEIETCTKICTLLSEAEEDLRQKRTLLFQAAERASLGLAACGTHPFSDWRSQRILNTVHYRVVEERLRYLAWRNLTYGMHVHIGLRGRERMIAVFNAIRGYLPYILALSANSPFSERQYTYFHSIRAQIFTRSFPRCNIPGSFKDWDDYAAFVRMLFDTGSITDPMQIWWSVRPHPWFGTIEIRICDCQSTAEDSAAVASFAIALVAQLCDDYDSGKILPNLNTNQLEENLWRGLRYGLSGKLVNFEQGVEVDSADAIRMLLDYTQDQWSRLRMASQLEHVYAILKNGNGAQKQIELYNEIGDVSSVFAHVVAGSKFNYARV